MNTRLLLTCCAALFFLHSVCAAPLSPESDKTGEEEAHHSAATKSVNLEDKVREAVHRAEQAASLAAQDSVRHGHKAETRVVKLKDSKLTKSTDDNLDTNGENSESRKHHPPAQNSDEGSHTTKRVKEHRVNQKPRGYGKLSLGDLGDAGASPNPYKEDTSLEDRLAMEAEEEKKYENGEGYGGGGGGSESWGEGGSKGANWASNIQRQDAAEKQSIQAQVASESAHELDEIQRAITAESQSSRGSATMGNSGATVVQVNGRPMSDQGRMQAQARQETAQALRAAGGQMDEAQSKTLEGVPASSDSQAQFGNVMNQGQSFGMPEESPGGSQSLSQGNLGSMSQSFAGMSQGSMGAQSMSPEGQGANEINQGSLGGALTGGGLGGGLSQGSMGGSLAGGGGLGGGGLGGGAIEAGGLGGGSLSAGAGAMGAAAFGASAGRLAEAGAADSGANLGGGAESSMSRMMGATAESPMSRMMGATAESPMSPMMGGAAESPMSNMMGGSLPNMASLMGQQSQGNMMQGQSNMMQAQGMPGGAASMMGGGAGVLQGLGVGGQFAGAQQMGYKKRSKTERVKDKVKKRKHNGVQKETTDSDNRRAQIEKHTRQHKDNQAKEKKSKLAISHHSKNH